MNLTPKQEAFAVKYVETGSASESYRLAYSTSRMTDKSVWELASRLMAKVKVASRIKELQDAIAEKSQMGITEWVNEVVKLCTVDPRDLMHPDGRIKMPHELDDRVAAAIASFKVSPINGIEYKFWDKNSALEKIAKHIGAYSMDNQQKTDPLTALLGALKGNVLGAVKDTPTEDDDD